MVVEHLGNIGYKGRSLQGAFLVGIEYGITELINSGKKVILMGTGETGFFAEKFLEEKGVKIYAYADNVKKQDTILRGRKIYSPYSLFDNKEYYFIIALPDKYIEEIRVQFMTHGVENYSIYFATGFFDFSTEDIKLQKTIMNAINKICFENEKVEEALPFDIWGAGGFKHLIFCLSSLRWSSWAYLWEKEILEKMPHASILEIGPGYGLMSLVLLKLFPDIYVDWLLMGKEETTLMEDKESRYQKGLLKIKTEYDKRVNVAYGYIERDEYQIKRKYDLIILTEVFEHFACNPINTVKKLANALNKGGKIVLTTPNWGSAYRYECWRDMPKSENVTLERYIQLINGHVYEYSKAELCEIFEEAGLEIEKYELSNSNNHNFVLKKIMD